MRRRSAVAVLACLTSLPSTVVARRLQIQNPNLSFDQKSKDRAGEIIDTFVKGWDTYKKYAWGHDEVTALSLNYSDSRNGWGASAVDALTTMNLMGLTDQYIEVLKLIQATDFTKTNYTVSFFETTIRYIGSMISAYELSSRSDAILKTKAIQLADKLMLAWRNDSVLPFGYLNFTDNSIDLKGSHNQTGLAEAGSNVIEFHKLTFHTDNTTYREMAEDAMKAIMRNKQIYPGLHALDLDVMTAEPIGDFLSWDGGADSFYEYLNKYALIIGNQDPSYLEAWWLAADSTIHQLLRQSAASVTDPKLGLSKDAKQRYYLSSKSEKLNHTNYGMGHLACFAGGNFLLGGKMLNNKTIMDVGLALTETCADSYALMPTGIGPERFYFVDAETRKISGKVTVDLNFYDKTAIIPSGGYYVRPEVIESMFYAYRITGDTVWQDRAWAAFEAMKTYCITPEGLCAPLTRVDRIPSRDWAKARGLQPDGSVGWEDGPDFRPRPEYGDAVESFWWGETLKYLYLIFAPPTQCDLDEYVFTTEAHPFRMDEAWHDSPRPSGIPIPAPSPASLSSKARNGFAALFIVALLGGAVWALTSGRRSRPGDKGQYEVVFDGDEEGNRGDAGAKHMAEPESRASEERAEWQRVSGEHERRSGERYSSERRRL